MTSGYFWADSLPRRLKLDFFRCVAMVRGRNSISTPTPEELDRDSAARGGPGPAPPPPGGPWAPPDLRRWLQLGLAALWVLDGVLQYQSFMFTRAFGRMLAGSADGNPALVADSVRWPRACIIERSPAVHERGLRDHPARPGLGIAWRPAVRVALAGSMAWSAAVGGSARVSAACSTATASPVSGAPGAVILYALLAVLIWPASRRIGRRVRGRRPAGRGRWPGACGSPCGAAWPTSADGGEPDGAGPARHDRRDGRGRAAAGWPPGPRRGRGGWPATACAASIALAVVLAAIAAGIFLPAPGARVTVVIAVAARGHLGGAQNLGEVLAGNGTDVNSGPLLALIALAYWPTGRRWPASRATRRDQPGCD